MGNISPDKLAQALADELAVYRQEVTEETKRQVRVTARECRDEIRRRSPKRSGSYKRGWNDKVAYEARDEVRVIVHNKKHYRLTHLLEYGHDIADTGGRVEGTPHIRPAEEAAAEKLLRRVKVVVKG